VNRRFQALYLFSGFRNGSEFAEALGIHKTYLTQIYKSGINPSFAKKLVKLIPNVNLAWLESGEGDPLISPPPPSESELRRSGQVDLLVGILAQLEEPALSEVLNRVAVLRPR